MDYENYENYEESVPVIPSKPKQNPVVRYAIIGVIAVVALALVISIITALVPNKFAIRDANSIDTSMNDDDEIVFIFNGKNMVEIPDDISKEIKNNYVADYNQNYAVFVSGKDNELYVVNSKKYVKVADEVSDFQLAPFGETMVYVADGDVYFVELSKPTKAKKIDSDVTGVSAISPDGESFAYYYYDEDEKEYECYVSKNGKKGEKKSKATQIFAVSDGAKYVYYTTKDKVCVNDTKLTDVKDWDFDYMLNRDGSQMIYAAKNSKGDYKVYASTKAGEKKTLGSGKFMSVLAPAGASRYSFCNVASFEKCAISVRDAKDNEVEYFYLKNLKTSAEKISALRDASGIQLLEDGTTALFVKKGDLRSVNITKPDSEAKVYSGFEEDVYTFDTSSDGEYIYVVDEDRTLYYVKSMKKAAKLEEDVQGFVLLDNGVIYFGNEDGELCYGKKTAKTKLVTDEFDSIDYDFLSSVFAVHSEDSYYVVNGNKMKKLFDLKTSENTPEAE